MPRYYFHARGPGRCITDHIGYELNDLAAAREVAFETIRDLVSDPFPRGDYRHWAMHIKDENERTLVTIPFPRAM